MTQALNSTTSMGQLTVNVLLSFAEFDREVTGERICDKIAAFKRRGMFMGGPVPIGYDVQERKLVINEAEAATVRHIFSRYVALNSGRELIEEWRADGCQKKVGPQGSPTVGGIPFTPACCSTSSAARSTLARSSTRAKNMRAGTLPSSMPRSGKECSSRSLPNQVSRGRTRNSNTASMLAGILQDGHGRRMSPSHAVKSGKRYRYYVTHAAELRTCEPPAWRMPATDVEAAITARLVRYFRDYRDVATLASARRARHYHQGAGGQCCLGGRADLAILAGWVDN